jgi:hypothetical protein
LDDSLQINYISHRWTDDGDEKREKQKRKHKFDEDESPNAVIVTPDFINTIRYHFMYARIIFHT